MIVAVDYFTNWVEVEPLEPITSKVVMRFLWKNVICRYGIPQIVALGNGRRFDSNHYREWCIELKIKMKYSSLGHLQANGQAEATNKALLSIMKKRLKEKKGEWAEELPGVPWAYRTSVKTPKGESPFMLAYWCEAVPSKVGLPSFWTLHFLAPQNSKAMEEARMLHEKTKAEQYFNKKVKPMTFKIGHLVLKESGMTTKEDVKLGSRWERPCGNSKQHARVLPPKG